MIRANNIHKYYDELHVLKGVHLDVQQKEIVSIVGASGAGKTTLAFKAEEKLFAAGFRAYVLDGDNIRHRLNSDLGFSPKDRTENIRRIGEVAALFAEAGIIVISALISPYQHDRNLARKAIRSDFHEIYLSANLDVCEQRDVKGLYKKARKGEIQNFTGVSAPYEQPENAELVIDTGTLNVIESLDILLDYAKHNFIIGPGPNKT